MKLESIIDLPIGMVEFGMLPYESHINNILSANNLEKVDYYASMLDIEGIKLLDSQGNIKYDFFIGRNITSQQLNMKFTDRLLINSEKKLKNFLKDSLCSNEYCYVSIDSSKVSSYSNFKRNSKVHSPLVVGLDFNKNMINICDFFDYKYYSSKWVDMEEFVNGYFAIQQIICSKYIGKSEKWVLTIENISISTNSNKSGNILRSRFKHFLEGEYKNINEIDTFDYINTALNTSSFIGRKCSKKVEVVNGIKTYQYIKDYLKILQEKKSSHIDGKVLALLYKHFLVINILLLRIGGLEEQKELVDSAVVDAQRLLLIGIKIQQTDNIVLYDKIQEIVKSLEKIDKKVIQHILDFNLGE